MGIFSKNEVKKVKEDTDKLVARSKTTCYKVKKKINQVEESLEELVQLLLQNHNHKTDTANGHIYMGDK